MIHRDLTEKCLALAKKFPVLTITGPRQSGKTTLSKALFPNKKYISLENPDQRRLAVEDPRSFLKSVETGAILDEIQRAPEIPSYLQEMVDSDPSPGRFVLTGSQQFEISQTISQSLAGRTAVVRLLPLSLREIRSRLGKHTADDIMLQGFYPRVIKGGIEPADFYAGYLETYIERDLRQLSQVGDLNAFEKFIHLVAGRVGQLLNASSMANDLGISQPTIKKWISLLQASYILFVLTPYYQNIGKRLVKTPKAYFYDVGLAAYLLGIRSATQLKHHPARGMLFENMIVIEMLKTRFNRGERSNLHFYRDQTGNEVDVIIEDAVSLTPVEIKASQTPLTEFFKGIKYFQRTFPKKAEKGIVVYSGEQTTGTSEAAFVPWNSEQMGKL